MIRACVVLLVCTGVQVNGLRSSLQNMHDATMSTRLQQALKTTPHLKIGVFGDMPNLLLSQVRLPKSGSEEPTGKGQGPYANKPMDVVQGAIPLFGMMLILSFMYRYFKKDSVPEDETEKLRATRRETLEKADDWAFSLFWGASAEKRTRHWKAGLMGCLCPVIRWADTMRMAGAMAFWVALVIYFVGWVACQTTYAWRPEANFAAYLVFVALMVYGRRLVRKKAAFPEHECGMCEDVVAHGCCHCCAVAQEARMIEEIYAAGAPEGLPERAPVPEKMGASN